MKPLARGYIHQAAFFISLCACSMLIMFSSGSSALLPNTIYSLSLISMYGVSALYHVPTWSREQYLFLRRIDHAAIFVLIAGSATPICLLCLQGEAGSQLLSMFWLIAIIGILMTTFWTHSPKWIRAFLYIVMGWMGVLYFPQIKSSLGLTNIRLLIAGGLVYTVGALIYALKWPNPFPKTFGYHEIFHIFVVIGSGLHFFLIYNLVT